MKGKIVIDKVLCKGCGYCVTACASGVIGFDKNFNVMGHHTAVPVKIKDCSGCGFCAVICPDIAIHVWRENKKQSLTKPGIKTKK